MGRPERAPPPTDASFAATIIRHDGSNGTGLHHRTTLGPANTARDGTAAAAPAAAPPGAPAAPPPAAPAARIRRPRRPIAPLTIRPPDGAGCCHVSLPGLRRRLVLSI